MPDAAAVDRAISFLEGQQLASGQFPMEVTYLLRRDPATGGPFVRPEKSPFCSAFIARSLSWCDDGRRGPMIARTLDFLEREKVRGSLWRYWCKDAPLHRQIPPDVDDTACISEALRSLGRGAPDNEALLLGNRNVEGLFYTWMAVRFEAAGNARWWWTVLTDVNYGRLVSFWRAGAGRRDVDSVVNANVLHYLGNRSETEPVIRWLLDLSSRGLEASSDKPYRNRISFYHALSRCHADGVTGLTPAIEHMERTFSDLANPDGRIGRNSLETALAVCAIINFGVPRERYRNAVRYLIESQAEDGGWESATFYCDARPVTQMEWGSRAVTTGFCLEALVRA